MDCKKILITGSTGFIGTNLVKSLRDNYQLYCLYHDSISYIQQDLSRDIDIDRLPSDVDCIIHLAGSMDKTIEKSKMFQINTVSTLNLLEYGKSINIKKFIYSSSGGVYGYNVSHHTEKSSISPIEFYGLTKYESELLINHYGDCFSTTILRLFFHYGEGQTKGIVPLLINKIKNNEPIIIYNHENPKTNPIYITDVVDIINRSISLDGNNVLNVAGDEIVSIKDMAELIGGYINIKPIFKYEHSDIISDLVGDNTAMKTTLGIKPKVTLDQGLRNIIQLKKSNKIDHQ